MWLSCDHHVIFRHRNGESSSALLSWSASHKKNFKSSLHIYTWNRYVHIIILSTQSLKVTTCIMPIPALIKGSPPPQVVSSLPVSRDILQLWQVKLAGAALSGPSGEGRGLLARGYTDGLLLRLKSFLDQATAQWGGEGGGNEL